MGPLGYQSSAQKSLGISYNCLDEYADTMHQALVTPYPPYESIGTQRDGEYIQLNTSIIQIENEFYGAIRPKRPVRSGERPLQALRSRGVEYVEVRCLDLNPMLDVGIDEAQVRFLDTFLLVCLLTESPPDTPAEIEALQANQLAIVERGRDPQLELTATGHGPDAPVNARQWARELLKACAQVATHLDTAHGNNDHTTATQAQLAKVDDDALTPSATILRHMGEQEIPFFRFSMNLAQEHGEYFRSNKLSDTQTTAFQESVTESFAQQKAIEDASTEPFEVFLENYLAL